MTAVRNSVHPRLCFALIFAALFFAIPKLEARIFDPDYFTLKNGMQVVVISNHRAPLVTHMVWYKVGSADEPRGKSGIAHFLEHLMFKGTAKVADGEFSRRVAQVGGTDNAFTSFDFTAYHQTIAAAHLDMVMEMEADRMRGLQLSEAQIIAERDVVLEERRSRTDNSPAGQLREQAQAAMYLAYPYRIPIIGWANEIKQLNRQDALAFYDRWYAPNNAILVVAGDVTAADVRRLAEKHYGVIAARDVPDRRSLRNAEPPQLAARHLRFESPQVRQPRWSRRYLAPSHQYGERQHVIALEILAEIIGSGATSRLYQAMVVDGETAISAGAWYNGGGLGPATFGFYATPKPNDDVAVVEAAINAEIAKLLKDGVTEDELARAKTRMTAEAILARDKALYPARFFGAALATGQSIADAEAWPEQVKAIDVAAVNAAARAVLVDRQSVTTSLLPIAKTER